jgi:hypothetical protein
MDRIHTTPDGRKFVRTGTVPHIRKDGSRTTLIRWVGQCAVCGNPFEVKSPGESDLSKTKIFLAKHCDVHKRYGALWGRK